MALRTLVVIPAYNEQDSIKVTVESVIAAGFDYVVVNDGSTDSTLEICRCNGFNVLDLEQNLGIGGAVQAGHRYALMHGYDVDVQFDGDGQHDVRCIPMLLEKIEEGFDLVIGSRFLEWNLDNFQSTFMRRVGIKWISTLIRAVTGSRVTDPTSGFRASGKSSIKLFAYDYPADYPEPESIVDSIQHGLKVGEVSVLMHPRQGGESSIRPLSSVYYMLKVTLAILIMAAPGRGKKRG